MAKSSPAQHEQGSLLVTQSEAPAAASSSLALLLPQIEALDKFAEENNLAILTEGKGSFTAALSVAEAIVRLKVMLTPAIMAPIMELQGTALGFKTDKDKPTNGDKPGYSVEAVRDVFIEATLKGFKMVGNQTNIIAGRFYATKEGFEDFFLRQGKLKNFTDYREGYSVPKFVSESEAIVTASANWIWNKQADKMENVQISIRVNKGQGADATLGKAKRKLLARIYSRVTGTVITEGDANEAIVVETRVISSEAAAAGQPGTTTRELASEDQKTLLKEAIGEHAEKANVWLRANNAIPKEGTFLDMSAKTAAKVIGDVKGFLKAIGALPE
jgi:hypothetical protein